MKNDDVTFFDSHISDQTYASLPKTSLLCSDDVTSFTSVMGY